MVRFYSRIPVQERVRVRVRVRVNRGFGVQRRRRLFCSRGKVVERPGAVNSTVAVAAGQVVD